ncbi:MAG: hypothetical protein KF837_08460 [Labilithrix sp.]|nr:hypothetical protein [Labilithrix sp.]
MRAVVAVVVPALLGALTSCDSAERRDAEVVLTAIHRFRSAPNESLPAMVDALRATPCANPDTCRARDECLALGESTAKALRLKSEVEQSLAALDKGTLAKDSAEAQSLPKKLDDAETLLKQGHAGLPRCDDAVQALKRKHRL